MHIDRRHFGKTTLAAAMGLLSDTRDLFAAVSGPSQITVDRITFDDFGLTYNANANTWTFNSARAGAQGLKVNGLSFGAFTWQWVGLSIAAGLLSGLGAAIFGALSDALFGQRKESMAEFLQKLIEELKKLIEEELNIHDLQTYLASVQAYEQLFREYLQTKDPLTLHDLYTGTLQPIFQLGRLSYLGYRPYMIAAGLRLAVLQEYIRRGRYGDKILTDMRDEAIAHHNAVNAEIDAVTSPPAVVYRFNGVGKWNVVRPSVLIPRAASGDLIRWARLNNEPFLDEVVDGTVLVWQRKIEAGSDAAELDQNELNLLLNSERTKVPQNTQIIGKIARLTDVRKSLKAKSTDYGDVIIKTWLRARKPTPLSPPVSTFR